MTTTSPHLSPTSPHTAGATSSSDLAPCPPPYGGEVAEKPTGHHHTADTELHPRGKVRVEVNP